MLFDIPKVASRLCLPLLALILILQGCDEAPTYSPLPTGTTVLAFGDSVTFGTGAGSSEDYPALLATATGWNIINAGIPGDTAQKGQSRIESLLKQHNPQLVIIGLGGNDFLRRRPEQAVKEDLRNIVVQVQNSGAIAALIAAPEFSLFRAGLGVLSDSPIYGELAEEEDAVLIAAVFSKVLSDDRLKTDAIHPNAKGYREMSYGILQAISQAGLYATDND